MCVCESMGLVPRRCSMNIDCIWIWNQLQEIHLDSILKDCRGIHSQASEVLMWPSASQATPQTLGAVGKTEIQQFPLKGWQSRGGRDPVYKTGMPQAESSMGKPWNRTIIWAIQASLLLRKRLVEICSAMSFASQEVRAVEGNRSTLALERPEHVSML